MRAEELLGRIREALGPREPEPPPEVDEELVRLAGPGSIEDLPDLFERRAREVGFEVHRCGADGVAACVRELPGASNAACESRWLPDLGTRPFDELYDGVETGITDVAYALAETGTLILHSGPGASRGLSLVPPRHIAIVEERDILPDMVDYWSLIRGTPPPSSRVFITGPSKTADIEGELVRGVHGPGEVHVVLVLHDVES